MRQRQLPCRYRCDFRSESSGVGEITVGYEGHNFLLNLAEDEWLKHELGLTTGDDMRQKSSSNSNIVSGRVAE